jgi:hypothetical protein
VEPRNFSGWQRSVYTTNEGRELLRRITDQLEREYPGIHLMLVMQTDKDTILRCVCPTQSAQSADVTFSVHAES